MYIWNPPGKIRLLAIKCSFNATNISTWLGSLWAAIFFFWFAWTQSSARPRKVGRILGQNFQAWIFILLMKLNSRMPWNGGHVVYMYFTVNFKSKNLITYLALVVFRFIWWHFFSFCFFRLDDSFLILPQITHLTLYTILFLYFRIVISVFMYTTRVLFSDSSQ